MAHVAGRKDAGHVGFEIEGIAIERPVGRPAIAVARQVGTGDKIAAFIAFDSYFFRPLGVRHAADANEETPRRTGPPLAGLVVFNGDSAQDFVAINGGHLAVVEHSYLRRRMDAVHQILR